MTRGDWMPWLITATYAFSLAGELQFRNRWLAVFHICIAVGCMAQAIRCVRTR